MTDEQDNILLLVRDYGNFMQRAVLDRGYARSLWLSRAEQVYREIETQANTRTCFWCEAGRRNVQISFSEPPLPAPELDDTQPVDVFAINAALEEKPRTGWGTSWL